MQDYFNYTITIKSDDRKKLTIINQILLLIAIIFLGKIIFDNYYIPRLKTSSIFLMIVIVIIILIWVYNYLKKFNATFRYAFFLAGLSFIFFFPDPLLKYLFGGAYILIGLMEKYIFQAKEVKVDKTGVLVNGFPGKFYSWQKISNMLIRDQLLTIDFTNNKIYQKEIEGEISSEIIQEFNDFAAQNIRNNK